MMNQPRGKMKIFNCLFVLSAVIAGINGFELNEIETLVKDEVKPYLDDFTSIYTVAENDMEEVAQLTKSKFANFGIADITKVLSSVGKSDACTNLTNDANDAYDLANRLTEFGINAVEEVTSALNDIINCADEILVDQLQCFYDKVKIVRGDILKLKVDFLPYRNAILQLYQTLLADYKKCLQEW